MKKQLIAIALATSLSTTALASERTSEESENELIGLGSGAAAGALVGGPIGAVVGGVIGLLIADDVNSDNKLEVAQQKINRKDQQLLALHEQYDDLKAKNRQQLLALEKQIAAEVQRISKEMETNIQFKTASFALEQHFQSQLDLLADSLRKNPDLVVNLSGFADRRGDATYNQTLSEQRVATVKDYLLNKGVKSTQVLTYAYGASNPLANNQSFESDFFDRRVLIKVTESNQQMTAANEK